jgi:UrcA family protein
MAPDGEHGNPLTDGTQSRFSFQQSLKEPIMTIKNTGGKNTVRMTWAILAAVSTTMLAGVTQAAGPGDDVPKQMVTYKDLNLNSNEGTQVLYRRIQGAANEVCGKVESRNLQGTGVKNACLDRAISQAVAAVNSPMLTRVYLAKTGKPAQQSLPVAQLR